MAELSLNKDTLRQVESALETLKGHLGDTIRAVHLFGSAVAGGLRPLSDIDLLVTVSEALEDATRGALFAKLLEKSAPPGESRDLRALEVTVVVEREVNPWRYPARREFQFGEWLRDEEIGADASKPVVDRDLAILLRKVRRQSVPLIGPSAAEFFEEVPAEDFRDALFSTLRLWNKPNDWAGDERNVILTLARIWFSIEMGRIGAKDEAAAWLLERLPEGRFLILAEAREAYLGQKALDFSERSADVEAFVKFALAEISQLEARGHGPNLAASKEE